MHQEKPRQYRACLQQYLLPCLWLRGGRHAQLKRLWTCSSFQVPGWGEQLQQPHWDCVVLQRKGMKNCRAKIQIHKSISGRFLAVRNVSLALCNETRRIIWRAMYNENSHCMTTLTGHLHSKYVIRVYLQKMIQEASFCLHSLLLRTWSHRNSDTHRGEFQ